VTYSPLIDSHRSTKVDGVSTPFHRIVFGDRLRELRKAAGWRSQEAFAHHAGLDRTYVSGLERGRRNPTLDIIVKLAGALGVHPAELFKTMPSTTEDEQPLSVHLPPQKDRYEQI